MADPDSWKSGFSGQHASPETAHWSSYRAGQIAGDAIKGTNNSGLFPRKDRSKPSSGYVPVSIGALVETLTLIGPVADASSKHATASEAMAITIFGAFAIYIASTIILFTQARWITLFVFSLFFFHEFIYGSAPVFGIIFICILSIERVVIALLFGGERFMPVFFKLCCAVALAGMLTSEVFEDFIVEVRDEYDSGVWSKFRSSLKRAGYGVVYRTDMMLYDKEKGKYVNCSAFRFDRCILNDKRYAYVVRVERIKNGTVLTCIGNESVLIRAAAFLTPYTKQEYIELSNGHRRQVSLVHANDTCEIVVPNRSNSN